jgi:drug/metabolite transporter (DMT)-like permease
MVVGREVLVTLPPSILLFSRLVGGAILFTPLALLEKPRTSLDRKHWGKFALCVLFGAVLNQAFFAYGLHRTTATHASIVSASIPLLTLLLATMTRRETLSRQRLLGMSIGLSGAIALIVFGRGSSSGQATLLGDLLIGCNCVCWAAFLTLAKDLSKAYGPMYLGSRLFLAGSVVIAPFCIGPALTYAPHVSGRELSYIAFIVLVPTVAAYALNQVAIRHHDASVVAIHWYLLPVFGVLGATLRLGEPLHLRVVAFAVLTCTGVLISAAPEGAFQARFGRTKTSR